MFGPKSVSQNSTSLVFRGEYTAAFYLIALANVVNGILVLTRRSPNSRAHGEKAAAVNGVAGGANTTNASNASGAGGSLAKDLSAAPSPSSQSGPPPVVASVEVVATEVPTALHRELWTVVALVATFLGVNVGCETGFGAFVS
jgi:hypothetical protein